VPDETPEGGWGAFIASHCGPAALIQVTEDFQALLSRIDEKVEDAATLDRYLGQITPIAKDIALEKTDKVRIMSLAGSKGLTVKAAIIVGLETGIVPLEGRDLAEERRLLYVGITRAEQYVFGTWALRRRGPTARAGRSQVNERRRVSSFIESGPVTSEDGKSYLQRVSPT
jgi:superfamily I DNA/RNA helicase